MRGLPPGCFGITAPLGDACPSRIAGLLALVTAALAGAPLDAQEIRGRVVDANNGVAVGLAGVFVMDAERNIVESVAADTAGYYVVQAPGAGEYILHAQRLGYFENETPLVAVEDGGVYGIDFELRPEPFRLDPLEVVVRNEELTNYLTLELGINPNSVFGYRAYQGIRLEEAKLKAHDNTDLLRELYIPVEHGIEGVCVGMIGLGVPGRPPATLQRGSGSAVTGGERLCGQLFVNDLRCPNEHIEEFDMDRIAVVVLLGGSVRLYTRDFDWTFNPNRGGAC